MSKNIIDKIFSCDDLSVFTDSIVTEFSFNGSSGSRFFLCERNTKRFLVKLSFHRKIAPENYGVVSSEYISPAEAEILILNHLKKHIIDRNYTFCILEILGQKTCSGKTAKMCASQSWDKNSLTSGVIRSFCRYNGLINAGLAFDKFSIMMMERCDMTFSDYILSFTNSAINVAVFKSLIWQQIHCLWLLRKKYPNLRHYDLHDENWMILFDTNYVFSAETPQFLIYPTSKKDKFVVPYFGMIPKMIDFGYATLPEIGATNVITLDKEVMHYRVDNEILFLFHHIYYKSSPGHGNHPEICAILESLDPTKSFVEYNTDHIRSLKNIPTYEEMMYNKIFTYKTDKIIRDEEVFHRFDAP